MTRSGSWHRAWAFRRIALTSPDWQPSAQTARVRGSIGFSSRRSSSLSTTAFGRTNYPIIWPSPPTCAGVTDARSSGTVWRSRAVAYRRVASLVPPTLQQLGLYKPTALLRFAPQGRATRRTATVRAQSWQCPGAPRYAAGIRARPLWNSASSPRKKLCPAPCCLLTACITGRSGCREQPEEIQLYCY